MKSLSRTVTALVLSVLAAQGYSMSAAAQDPAPAAAPAPIAATAAADNRPSSQSGGFRGAINSVSLVNNQYITVQIALQNTSKTRQYFLVFGSHRAATDSGAIGEINEIAGTDACRGGGDDQDNLRRCLADAGKDINNYSYIESNDIAVISIKYYFQTDPKEAKTLSLALKMVVRTANGDSDPLSDSAKSVGAPHVVILNFPLVPVKSDQ